MAFVNYRNLKSFGGTPVEQKLNAVVDALQAVSIAQGVGYTLSQSPVGTTLNLPAPPDAATYPFELIDATTKGSDGTINYAVRVVYGGVFATVEGSGQVYVVPTGFNGGDYPPVIISGINADGGIYLNVQTSPDTFQIDPTDSSKLPSVTYQSSYPSNSANNYYLGIGSIQVPASGAFLYIGQNIQGPVGFIDALGMPVWY